MCWLLTVAAQARFPFKRNRLRWQAANHGCHCFDRAFLLAGACVVCCVKISRNKRKRQPIGMLGRSSGNHDWLRLRFLRFSFTQRTQRKRLRLNGNRALGSGQQWQLATWQNKLVYTAVSCGALNTNTLAASLHYTLLAARQWHSYKTANFFWQFTVITWRAETFAFD